jgi:hypothetical protein
MVVVAIGFGKELYGPDITGILTSVAAYTGPEEKCFINAARRANEAHPGADIFTAQDQMAWRGIS